MVKLSLMNLKTHLSPFPVTSSYGKIIIFSDALLEQVLCWIKHNQSSKVFIELSIKMF